ncbi:MAG: AAA family ATPase [Candidatus Cloacimonetes bacterium]|nr:AAA family ATPase [Candidatus Cloacimonadota bacterium]
MKPLTNNFGVKLNSRKNYDLFGSEDCDRLHYGKLFIHLFGEYFSRYSVCHRVKVQELTEDLIKHYSLESCKIIKTDKAETDIFKADEDKSRALLIVKYGFMVLITQTRTDLIYGTCISEAERNEVLQRISEFKIDTKKTSRFHMIQNSMGFLEMTDFEIKPYKIDLETHYNDDFRDIHKLISGSLMTENKNGLVLLHGLYGTGKTYYLRHLISSVERKFIYFPLNLIEAISSPDFLPFISSHPNSVLILEDCESLLVSRDNGISNVSALSNLLNLSDGLLSDALSINVICTFNSCLKKIDDAILRKGRLLARYELKELEIDKANSLARQIGKNDSIRKPMTVSEIYNLDEKGFDNLNSRSVGFRARY